MGNLCPCINPIITEKHVEVNLVNADVLGAIKTIIRILRKYIDKDNPTDINTLNKYFQQINITNPNILSKLQELPTFIYPSTTDSTLVLKPPTQLDNGAVYAGYWYA